MYDLTTEFFKSSDKQLFVGKIYSQKNKLIKIKIFIHTRGNFAIWNVDRAGYGSLKSGKNEIDKNENISKSAVSVI